MAWLGDLVSKRAMWPPGLGIPKLAIGRTVSAVRKPSRDGVKNQQFWPIWNRRPEARMARRNLAALHWRVGVQMISLTVMDNRQSCHEAGSHTERRNETDCDAEANKCPCALQKRDRSSLIRMSHFKPAKAQISRPQSSGHGGAQSHHICCKWTNLFLVRCQHRAERCGSKRVDSGQSGSFQLRLARK